MPEKIKENKGRIVFVIGAGVPCGRRGAFNTLAYRHFGDKGRVQP